MASSYRKSKNKRNMRRAITVVALLVFIAAIVFLIITLTKDTQIPEMLETPTSTPQATSTPGVAANVEALVISEVLTSNEFNLVLDDGRAPDWIELYNGTDSEIALNGYGLSDNPDQPFKFTFPAMSIMPGQYLLILCGGEEETNGRLETRFNLSSDADETITLVTPSEEIVATLPLPEMEADISYGLNENAEYLYFAEPSPGEANRGQTSETPIFEGMSSNSAVLINEYSDANDFGISDEDGDRSDWVEIKNASNETVDLSGYALSDNPDNPNKWILPPTQLASGEILLVFLSGKDRTEGELHTSFMFGSEDPSLQLTDASGRKADVVYYDEFATGNVSKGRDIANPENWLYYLEPTPGLNNTTQGFSQIDKSTATLPPA